MIRSSCVRSDDRSECALLRLLCWHPCGEQQQKRRKVLAASSPDLSCRFVKEGSMDKSELLADIDHVDVTARAETLNAVPGQPVMLQLGTVPAYALTALSLALFLCL